MPLLVASVVGTVSPWCSLPGDVFCSVLELLPAAHRCLLPQVCSSWRALASMMHSDADYWRILSLKKWGPAVMQYAPPALRSHADPSEEATAWRRYYIQRVAWFDLPTSPFQLIQENQRGDPWRVMVACQVASRTGASLAKHSVLASILSAFPTPSAVICAPQHTLAAMMERVGMQQQRAHALIRMSEGFLGDWQTPSQLYGIGPFGQDSVHLFQKGAAAWAYFKTSDSSLRSYLSWARADLKKLKADAASDSTSEQVVPEIQDGCCCLVSLHTPAQAHLMARTCSLGLNTDSKRCANAAAAAAAVVVPSRTSTSGCAPPLTRMVAAAPRSRGPEKRPLHTQHSTSDDRCSSQRKQRRF
jgi:hypothetical protein